MSIGKRFVSVVCVAIAAIFFCRPAESDAQFLGNPFATNFGVSQTTNSVDLDLLAIIQCQVPQGTDPIVEFQICQLLLPDFVDQLVEAEAFLDQVFAGYRDDIPVFLRRRINGPVRLQVVIDAIDGPGGTLAQAGPNAFANLIPNPFFRFNEATRAWSIPRSGTITMDVDDIVFMILTGLMVDVAVHEAFHAMGHPSAFEMSGLNGPTNIFNQVNFLGDPTGIEGAGFGLVEFRQESGNPFAQFVPLSQEADPMARGGHLSAFEPAFNRPNDGVQEVFLPSVGGADIQGFMSRSLQGMFADLGYKVRGINADGFADIDQDGIADDPLIVNPVLPDEPQP